MVSGVLTGTVWMVMSRKRGRHKANEELSVRTYASKPTTMAGDEVAVKVRVNLPVSAFDNTLLATLNVSEPYLIMPTMTPENPGETYETEGDEE